MTTPMETRTYVVRGGRPLTGEITIPGAKNAVSKQIVASLLTEEDVTLTNVPDIGETHLTFDMVRALGVEVAYKKGTAKISAAGLETPEVSAAVSRKNRIPILFLGPLLHRFGKAAIPALGGDAIGPRPVNFHFDALQKMGAKIEVEEGMYVARADRLQGTVIDLPYPSVGATENSMLAAVLAKGTTVIRNAAVEPEIVDLAMLLQSMGAVISLEVNRTWVIEGVDTLSGATHRVIPDRLVAASFAVAAALTKGDVLIKEARQVDLISFLNAMRRVGVPYEVQDNGIRFMAPEKIEPIALETDVHPGFMTDWQQTFVPLLTQADGVSILHETVYEDRFGYTESLRKMGAKIQVHRECLGSKPCRFVNRDYRHSAVIVGPTPLKGERLVIPDIRAGFSYIIAALIANGTSYLTGVEHVERGYGDIIHQLQSLGADITAVTMKEGEMASV